ncbi:ABC transporter ATP-binding protein [Pseudomonas sp. CCI1.2]|uniref:ABC transporter ATP-binding protein n=1 Tax=Pseudomonas sp. CCI1.2 TaxID=3048614 RepID=UPI002B23413C|nr:ABC transporter ATP-binding protein [Pseudomonas sp. CCI1.2]MEB0120480.1 ABC transporter ATP-binding protein [Pseudomonas sp. CCI1.2]
MSSDVNSITVSGLGKCFAIFNSPHQRLLQMFMRSKKKYYREFWALRDVSFELKKGETVGIIGRNGSGKSTLLQMICGTLNQTEGDISINGKVAALLELGAGFNPEFTGRENVFLSAALYGLSQQQVTDKFEAITSFADIGDFIDQPVKIYSSGMFVRLAFAIIVNVDADILIIDEALAVGDALFTQKCMRFLRKFKENGTLLFVSHDTASVINLCDRAIWLDKGQVKGYGPAKEISELYLANLFEGEIAEPEIIEDLILPKSIEEGSVVWRDHRQDFINNSIHRNDIEIFRFDPSNAEKFGQGGAKILNVRLQDMNAAALNWVVGGETVTLKIEVVALTALVSPIVGFYVKDRLGQTLFGDNTYVSYARNPIRSSRGDVFIAEFKFPMPWLAQGDYSIAVAVAEGTQSDHVHHQWIHDALLFRSHHDPLSTGIVGIPMLEINLQVRKEANEQY